MKKCLGFLAAFGLVSAVVLASTRAQDEKPPTIKQVMAKVPKSALPKVAKALKGAKPNWKSVKKESEVIVKYTKALAENNPPKGEKEAWKEKAGAFYDSGKALFDAAEAENLEEARASLKKMQASCKECHDAHKGR